MFAFSTEELSSKIHDFLLSLEIELLSQLKIPFRVLDMPSEELGNSAYRKYDIEMHIPSKGYGEVTSATNCTDYQSKRLNICYRAKGEKKLVHTLNATAIAAPRVIAAILENYALDDGSVIIPDALQKYMLNTKKIMPKCANVINK
jgi:seryl-tRNA synthetase